MRRFSSSFLLVSFILAVFAGISFTTAASLRTSEVVQEESFTGITYPEGEAFARLKILIDETFSVQKKKAGYSYSYLGSSRACISGGWLCTNYKYTSLTEKSIKYIILETYKGNEDFYKKLFQSYSYYSSYSYDTYGTNGGTKSNAQVSEILRLVPTGTKVINPITSIFSERSSYSYYYGSNNVGNNLLSSSFGIDFTENNNQNGMLSAIEQKIKDMKRTKCQKLNQTQSYSYDTTKCPWNGEISNAYLPTLEELLNETIYLNGRSVRILSVKDEFEYIVEEEGEKAEVTTFERKSPYPKLSPCPTFPREFSGDAYLFYELSPYGIYVLNYSDVDKQLFYVCTDSNGKSGAPIIKKGQYIYKINGSDSVLDKRSEISSAYNNGGGLQTISLSVGFTPENVTDTVFNGTFRGSAVYPFGEKEMDKLKVATTESEIRLIEENIKKMRDEYGADSEAASYYLEEVEFYKNKLNNDGSKKKYTLRYTHDSYTLEEAQAELEKKQAITETVFRGGDSSFGRLPCSTGGSYMVRSQCAAASANMNTIITAIGAYYSDKERYPDTIDALDRNYIYKENVLEDFKKNFSYKSISGATTYTNDYEITYIGKIGEGALASSDTVDYEALLSGVTVPEIPSIFSHAPSDSAVLYIKNPQNLFALLETKSNTTTRLSGMDVSQSVKLAIQEFFELKDFSTLETNLKHESLLVIENLDFSAPDVTLILSEDDRAALSPSAKARVVGSKDGFIYVSNSKSTIDRFMGLESNKSLSASPDFRYVWTKKSALIKDAYMYVGDAFFEKMLTLETYITHYRKMRDVERLGKLQELVWSYQDAFGKLPSNLEELLTQIDTDGKLKEFISEYTLGEDGKIVHKNIGTLGSIKTIPEVNYDLSKISRKELEDYRTNVLKYRDVWRASLDPMGIVLNRYGDGMEVDFFMTPIPKLEGDLRNVQDLFQGVSKDSFEYLKNPNLRMGLLTFVAGFDPKKLEKKAESMKELSDSINETNTELLDGKNIFDYIGGEGAFTLGNIPSDILDGWNVEKIDAHIAIEFTTEEKGKEFVDIVRKKFLSEFENSRDGYLDVKSFFAKPLIEDYEGKQIYYIEAIPVPFVGKLGFAYTFIDNFFFIGLNRTSMRHVIDVAKSGDSAKKELIDDSTVLKNSFFVSLLDGNGASRDLKGLYEKNRTSIPRYAALLDKNENGLDGLNQALSSYYVTSVKSKRLGLEVKPFEFSLGGLSVKEVDNDMWILIDTTLQNDLSGTTLQLWENISTDERFPKEILSEKGISVQEFLMNSMKSEILAFELIVKLDRVFEGDESLLRNSTFSFAMDENEIGFLSRVFRNKDAKGTGGGVGEIFSNNQGYLVWGGGFLVLILLLGGVFFYYRKRKLASTSMVASNFTQPPLPAVQNLPPGIVLGNAESVVLSPSSAPKISEIVQSVEASFSPVMPAPPLETPSTTVIPPSVETPQNISEIPKIEEEGNTNVPPQS